MSRSGVAPDTIAGRYRVTARIASGGMGQVYRARDQVLGRTVAVKVLPSDLAVRPGFVERFRAEAQAAARLSHPNVVQVHDWGEAEDTYFMVMEYVRGRNLREVLAVAAPLAPRRAAEVVSQLLGALAAAHESGLVHRDVKPENCLVTVDGTVKVTDFGIARLAEGGRTSGELFGTVAYAAPEQIRGEKVDLRADLYAAGCVLYELLAGAPPFEGDVASVLRRHLEERVPPPSRERPEAGAELDRVVLRATDPDPSGRYASAREMAADLDRAAGSLPEAPPLSELAAELTSEVAAEAMETVVPAGRRRPRRLRWVLLALLLTAAGAGGWLLRPVEVPDVGGLAQSEAQQRLVGAGFSVDLSFSHSDERPGTVLGTEPAAGKLARRGGTVVVEVSRGPQVAEVPRVVGMSVEDARKTLREAGLLEGEVTEQFAREPAGTVVDQNPRGGQVRAASPVGLVVSRGPELVDVPEVRGKLFDEAQAALQGAGFAVLKEEAFNDAPAGTVLDQAPKPGERVERGSQARLAVSKGPEPFAMPDVGGKTCGEARIQLEELGLGVVVQSRSGACAANRVLGQDPLPGATVRKGQEVTLYVP